MMVKQKKYIFKKKQIHKKKFIKGGPVFIIRTANNNVKDLMKVLTEEQVTQHVVFTTNVHWRTCDELTRKNRRLTKTISVNDMKDFSMFEFDKKFVRGFFFFIANIFINNILNKQWEKQVELLKIYSHNFWTKQYFLTLELCLKVFYFKFNIFFLIKNIFKFSILLLPFFSAKRVSPKWFCVKQEIQSILT